jgi:NDP-sugar pyrophosphorylase family protein
MQVVILAGGIATRMRPLSERLPKSLFPVAGRPFLEWQLELLARGGAERALLCVGHFGAQIRAHLARSRPPMPVALCDDGERPLGTGGALRAAVRRGLVEPRCLVTYGDSYLPVDLRPLLAAHLAAGMPATMAVYANADRWDRSNLAVAAGRVVRYDKRVEAEDRAALRYIDYGVSVVERDEIARWDDPDPLDLALAHGRLAALGRLAAHEVSERFYEIGSPEGLRELDARLAGDVGARS